MARGRGRGGRVAVRRRRNGPAVRGGGWRRCGGPDAGRDVVGRGGYVLRVGRRADPPEATCDARGPRGCAPGDASGRAAAALHRSPLRLHHVGRRRDETKARRAIDLSLEKYCSVVASLASDIQVTYDVALR